MSIKDVVKMIEDNDVRFVDLRFTDTKGKQHHFTIPARVVLEDPEEWFENGQAFDGSSIGGWKGIQASDMQLRPDATTAFIDPFYDDATVVLTCDVIDPADGKGYDRDPRSIAKRAEAYLKSSGIGDTAFFGPEPEFFVFDGVAFETHMDKARFEITSETGAWSSGKHFDGQNTGHRSTVKGGYAPVAPVDAGQDLRSAMVRILEEIGIPVEVHHGEVATGSQMEIGTKFSTLVKRADWTQDLKYVVWNTAHNFGKTATFMPKPLMGDNGSGMHVHQSIWKDGKNLFSGDGYAGLSETALFYIGGVIKH
ncbi:glutamine synthetase beta-grasp domain-containing protein, partial [Kingella kingae]